MIIGTAMIAPYLRCIPGSPRGAVGSYHGQTRRLGATLPPSLGAGPFSLLDRTIYRALAA